MTQEQKDLLLKDLCGILPYGVILNCCEIVSEPLTRITYKGLINDDYDIDEVKPYLFPLSSITDEQKYDFYCRFIENDCYFNDFKEFYLDNNMWHKMLTSVDDCDGVVDWFNKNHFDYRGLIPMRLADDATGLNIY